MDVLLPLFFAMQKKYNLKIKVYFTVNKIFHDFNSNKFYKSSFEQLNIKSIKYQLPNKFDYRDKIIDNKFYKILFKLYFIILKIVKYPLILPKFFWADFFMHEYSNQTGSTWPLYFFHRFFPKKIFVYIHGQSLNQPPMNPRIVTAADKSIMLVWHENNIPLVKSMGYKNLYIIGMTKFYSEWINHLDKYNQNKNNNEKFVLIFTRNPDHKYFMNHDLYKYLLLTSYNVIRKNLGDIKIKIKCHPRENKSFVNGLISNNNMKNISISNEHAGILSKSAYLAISFWTSAILDSLSVGTPSVEFYKEPENFRFIEPKGSMYKKYNFDCVSNEKDLTKFITKVEDGKFNSPKITEEFYNFKDINFL